MTRVAVLSHVKESTISATAVAREGPRIPWGGGKIVSNKDEALRKFYERKLLKGVPLTPEQQRALEALKENANFTVPTASVSSHKQHNQHPKTPKQMAHRAHVKAQSSSSHHQHKKARVVNGRVVGPPARKVNVSRTANVTHPKKSPKKQQQQQSASNLALQDKLSMSLDALVKRGAK